MGYTNFPNGITSMGSPVVGFPTPGNVYFLDPTNGNDSNDGKNVSTAFKTLTTAYAALTDGKNDVLYYIAGTSSISLSAAFDWAKSYTHFIGVAAPTMIGSRARIFQTASATALSPLITVSGIGCIWENIYVFQGVADATSLVAVSVTGDRNSFKRCQFVGGGHETNNIDDSASLQLAGAYENTFDECVFGSDTTYSETGSNVLRLTTVGSRNIFKGCIFQSKIDSDGTAAALVEATGNDSLNTWTLFDNCSFIVTSDNRLTAMATAFVLPANTQQTATYLLKGCVGVGFSKWDTNDRNVVFGDMGTPTGIDLSGVALALDG
jgi:hypothetical protein